VQSQCITFRCTVDLNIVHRNAPTKLVMHSTEDLGKALEQCLDSSGINIHNPVNDMSITEWAGHHMSLTRSNASIGYEDRLKRSPPESDFVGLR
jgi:hypothetical protein